MQTLRRLRWGALALTLMAAPSAARQDPSPQPPPQEEQAPEPERERGLPVPELGQSAQSQTREEMTRLFHEVENRLAEIDRMLFDASAGGSEGLGDVQESGIGELLQSARDESQSVLEGIDRIVELAQQSQQQQSSGSGGAQQQPQDGDSPLDGQPQRQGQKEQTPDNPGSRPHDEKPGSQGQPDSPRDSDEPPENPRGRQPAPGRHRPRVGREQRRPVGRPAGARARPVPDPGRRRPAPALPGLDRRLLPSPQREALTPRAAVSHLVPPALALALLTGPRRPGGSATPRGGSASGARGRRTPGSAGCRRRVPARPRRRDARARQRRGAARPRLARRPAGRPAGRFLSAGGRTPVRAGAPGGAVRPGLPGRRGARPTAAPHGAAVTQALDYLLDRADLGAGSDQYGYIASEGDGQSRIARPRLRHDRPGRGLLHVAQDRPRSAHGPGARGRGQADRDQPGAGGRLVLRAARGGRARELRQRVPGPGPARRPQRGGSGSTRP